MQNLFLNLENLREVMLQDIKACLFGLYTGNIVHDTVFTFLDVSTTPAPTTTSSTSTENPGIPTKSPISSDNGELPFIFVLLNIGLYYLGCGSLFIVYCFVFQVYLALALFFFFFFFFKSNFKKNSIVFILFLICFLFLFFFLV